MATLTRPSATRRPLDGLMGAPGRPWDGAKSPG